MEAVWPLHEEDDGEDEPGDLLEFSGVSDMPPVEVIHKPTISELAQGLGRISIVVDNNMKFTDAQAAQGWGRRPRLDGRFIN